MFQERKESTAENKPIERINTMRLAGDSVNHGNPETGQEQHPTKIKQK